MRRPSPRQRVLLCGLNCLRGQLDLFPSDGPPEQPPEPRNMDRTGQRLFGEIAEGKNHDAEIAFAMFDYYARTTATPRYKP